MKNNGNYLALALACSVLIITSLVVSKCQSMPASETKKEEPLRSPADFESTPKPVIVAVVDTGYDFKADWTEILKAYPQVRKPRTCKYGNVDFTGTGLQDNHGHGTHIAGLIAQYADNSNYCLVIMKYFNKTDEKIDHMDLTEKAFQRAIDLKVDIINYSGGGNEKNTNECNLMKKALDAGIVVVAAAGNESSNINKSPYYPAMCDSRIKVVGNTYNTGDFVASSNFTDNGPKSVHLYTQNGYNVLSLAPSNQMRVMTGTSQAAAIQTGKIIKDWNKH